MCEGSDMGRPISHGLLELIPTLPPPPSKHHVSLAPPLCGPAPRWPRPHRLTGFIRRPRNVLPQPGMIRTPPPALLEA